MLGKLISWLGSWTRPLNGSLPAADPQQYLADIKRGDWILDNNILQQHPEGIWISAINLQTDYERWARQRQMVVTCPITTRSGILMNDPVVCSRLYQQLGTLTKPSIRPSHLSEARSNPYIEHNTKMVRSITMINPRTNELLQPIIAANPEINKYSQLSGTVQSPQPITGTTLRTDQHSRLVETNQYPELTIRPIQSSCSTDTTRVWKTQDICCQIIERLTGRVFLRDGFYDWLLNPLTNRTMQLDGYNEELRLAFEYQGEQHYRHVNYFHKYEEQFLDILRRDQLKLRLCFQHDVELIIIPYNVGTSVTDLERYIRAKLPLEMLVAPPIPSQSQRYLEDIRAGRWPLTIRDQSKHRERDWISLAELYSNYQHWAQARNLTPKSRRTLSQYLDNHYSAFIQVVCSKNGNGRVTRLKCLSTKVFLT